MPTSIEWTEETWNPVTGCSKVSPGCDHCYAETLSLRYGWSKKPWTPGNAAENVVLHPERLDKPLSWRKPRMIFVNSMSDLFHEQIPDEFIHDIFQTMERAERHTFQVLTKRPRRALEALVWLYTCSWCEGAGCALCDEHTDAPRGLKSPLPNVWIGVSIESWRYNWRADVLRDIPAAVRFISAEPLLDTLMPSERPHRCLNLGGIDWLIVGGESGPGFRPMAVTWARELRDACLAVGGDRMTRWVHATHGMPVQRPAFFFKQWGGRTPKAGGRLLDGREWNEMPRAASALTSSA